MIDSPVTEKILEMLYSRKGRDLSKDAVESIEYDQITSDPILFDEMLRDKEKRGTKAK